MPKRKKSNPLSQARQSKKKVEDIWFRKSNLGYKCFIEFYASQPDLVFSSAAASNESFSLEPAGPSSTQPIVGMSRAAKKRRKRKGRDNQKSSTESAVPVNRNASTRAGEERHQRTKNNHPLLSALCESKNASHLHDLVQVLVQPLPVTFRIRRTAAIETVLADIKQFDVRKVSENIFQAPGSKATLSPNLKDFLFQGSQSGLLARQELGSMLPVRALEQAGCFDKPPTMVLDMCASPGSKTLQAFELLSSKKTTLVANDVHPSRLQSLKEAVQRSGVPSTNRIVFTCQDAAAFSLTSSKHEVVLFDVIICDVPCSGDGTCRKDKHILPGWRPEIGNALHQTQLNILLRGCELLKPNGCICYSTCSLNPVENEAVVGAALDRYNRQHADTVELMEVPEIDGVQLRSGVSRWKIAEYFDEEETETATSLRWIESFDAASCDDDNGKWLESQWPNPQNGDALTRCKRLHPPDGDSGAFFLALLRKVPSSTL